MERFTTLKALIEDCGARGPRPAVIAFGDSAATWSYGEIGAHALRLASGLKRKGVSRLEPVLLWAPNSPEWIVAYFATVCAGALAVPFNDLAGGRELAHVVRDCGCQRVFTVARHVGELRALEGGDRLEIILLDAATETGAAADAGVAPWRGLMAPQAALPELGPGDPASLLYTSGTTGVPKGVPLTHRNFLANLEAVLAHDLAGPSDRVFLPLPLHHAYAFTVGLLAAFGTGAALVLPAGLSGPQMTAALKGGRASILIGVPRLYTALIAGIMARVKARGRVIWMLFGALLAASIWLSRRTGVHAGRYLFAGLHRQIGPSLRIVASGGARLDADTAWTLEGLGWTVLTGYGLTETAPLLTFSAPKRRRVGTEGFAT
ncbi:MAG: AMP-binding protein, partial [Alphaproteobacteria bacterium]